MKIRSPKALRYLVVYLLTLHSHVFLYADDSMESYSNIFFGLGTEFTVLPGIEDTFLKSAMAESICMTAALGDRKLIRSPPLRIRGGLGFWPDRYFVSKLGIEVPLLEFLNSMKARMFGLYMYLDGIMRIGSSGIGCSVEPSVRLLLPISAVGGIGIGIGHDSVYGISLHLDYLAGFYALE